MEFLPVLLIALATFGVCFFLDKGFARLFRNTAQHKSGKSVRANKRYAAIGLVLGAIGVASMVFSEGSVFMLWGGLLVLLLGSALVIYYMTFGIFYDEDTMLLSTFGRKGKTYSFRDICGQQLLSARGSTLIELHFSDGRTVGLQPNMQGVYPFLDAAFAAWCRQTGRRAEDCTFYDPQNSCWFPPIGEEP